MTTKKLSNIPSLTDDPAYAAGKAKLTELQTALGKTTGRIAEAINELNQAATGPTQKNRIIAAAMRLLGRDTEGQKPSPASLREELEALYGERSVLEAAVALQREALAELRADASRRIVAGLAPMHREMVKTIAERIVELDAALAAERDFRDELFQKDILSGSLRPMPLIGFGSLKDENSRASSWMLEAVEHGYLAIKDLPKNLQSWGRAKLHRDKPAAPALPKSNDGWVHA